MPETPDMPDRAESGGLARYEGRYRWLSLAGLVLLGMVLARLWYLQLLRGEEFYRASEQNIVQTRELEAPRGRIFDRNGVAFAQNRASYEVVISPHILGNHDVEATLERLARHLNLTDDRVDDLRGQVDSEQQDITVRSDATRSQIARLETDKMRLPGVDVEVDAKRHYPLHSVAAHTIGFMGEIGPSELENLRKYGYGPGDYLGRMGLEEAFESVLRGSPGVERKVVNARGIPQGEAETRLLLGDNRRVEPVPGRDLHLTLDAELQLIVDEAMEPHPSGAVVAVDPRDGSVRALYSKPSFNPNSWSGQLSQLEKMRNNNDPFKPMLDKTVRPYFPGSIYKIAGAYAGLDQGVVEAGEELNCPGYYKFGGRRFRCWKWGGHDDVDMREAIQQSCDVYFYKLADRLGMDRISEYAFRFGFGEKTGIPHNSESAGRVPTKEWHRENSPNGYQHGFALNTVLGQGNTMVTPLQAAMAYAAIANGGDLYYPRIVDQIRSGEGERLFEFAPEVRKGVGLSDKQLEVIRDGLRRVMAEEGGTGYDERLEDIEVSGKTGTAQVHKIGRVRVPNREKAYRLRDHAWFASYAPSDDPEIVVVVFLEHAGHGGEEAAPVATEIIEKYFNREERDSLTRKLGRQVDRHPRQTGASDE
jgi:penicillin-binding protein 2